MARRKGDWLTGCRMAKRFDGSGVVKLQCSESVFAALKLSEMPRPTDWETLHGDSYRGIMDTRQMGADSERYRVIWPQRTNGPGSKLRTSSFTLSGAHTNETLFVLAEFLRDQGVEFVGLANKHGNRLRDIRLSGSKLAYLASDMPHSPARRIDFVAADSPELSRASGRAVHDAPLNSETN